MKNKILPALRWLVSHCRLKPARFSRLLILTIFCSLLSAISTLQAQDPAQFGTPFAGVPDPRDAVIYQVNMRAFSSTHNFQGVINRLDNIKALGTNVIYLMPVFPVGVLKSVNSPYCISNFNAVGSEFGTLTDLRNLVSGAHTRGMAVMLDWVVNQTSFDHPWITQHPDWYLKDASGNIESLPGFTDVAALNFSNAIMRDSMIQDMRDWVFNANIDGFRCDFADNPPIDFWTQAIGSLRGITTHKLLMLAEGTRSTNYGAGFDYNFGFQFYGGTLKSIFGGGAATQIDNSNTVEYTGSSGTKQIVRYLTNHDVDGSDGAPVNLFGGKAGSMAAFVVIAYMKSVPFIYNGTEVAFPTAITFPFTSVTIDWTINPDVTAEYTKVIAFRDSSVAIRRGTLVSYTSNDVCAFTKTSGTQEVVVFSNLRNATIAYSLPAALANTTWKDAFTGATVTLGTSLSLTAYQYRVMTNASVPVVHVTGVTVSPTTASVHIGATQQLTATIAPSTATNKTVTWSSSNTAVATVSTTGLVTAVAAGSATITVTTQDGSFKATSAITVSSATGATYYQILNRWQPNTYLFDAGNGQVKYGTSPASTNQSYQWAQVSLGNGFIQLQNRATGNFMNVEGQTGNVQCGAVQSTWFSAMWTIAPTGDGWNYIQNRWIANQWIHIENLTGIAQYAGAQTGWYSAMWQFVNPVVVAAIAPGLRPGDAASVFGGSGPGSGLSSGSAGDGPVGLFPNPVAHGKSFTITMPSLQAGATATVTVRDLSGKALLMTRVTGTSAIAHHLMPGIYFVTILSREMNISKKLIVQ